MRKELKVDWRDEVTNDEFVLKKKLWYDPQYMPSLSFEVRLYIYKLNWCIGYFSKGFFLKVEWTKKLTPVVLLNEVDAKHYFDKIGEYDKVSQAAIVV